MKKVIIIFISIVFLNSCFNENNTKDLEEIRKTELVKIKEPKKEILKISEKEEFLNFVTKIGKNVDLLKTINCKKFINVKVLKYCNEKKIAYLKSINNSKGLLKNNKKDIIGTKIESFLKKSNEKKDFYEKVNCNSYNEKIIKNICSKNKKRFFKNKKEIFHKTKYINTSFVLKKGEFGLLNNIEKFKQIIDKLGCDRKINNYCIYEENKIDEKTRVVLRKIKEEQLNKAKKEK